MFVWIAHFLCRCHASFFDEIRKSLPHVWALDWFFYHDKFPGDRRSADFFNTIVRYHVPNGNIRLATFNESDVVETDLLADNLAGLFNEYARDSTAFPILEQVLRTGQVYYECAQPL